MSSTHDAESGETSDTTTIEDISNAAYVPTAEEHAFMIHMLSFPIPEFVLFKNLVVVNPITPDAPLSQIEGHLAGASSIQRMPFDVMEVIFLHCLPTGRKPMISEKEAPILLTHVCREWRNAAHSMPVLWFRIHFPVPTLPSQLLFYPRMLYHRYERMFNETLEYRCAMAKTWMLHSAGIPLDITIHELDPQDHHRDALDMILDVLAGQSLCWKNLELFISIESFEHLSRRLSADDLPALESLSVVNSGMCDSLLAERVEWAPLAILEAPKLREVCFRDIPDSDLIAIDLNWSMLTKVSLEGRSWGLREDMTVDKIITILGRCKSLIECRFEIDNYKQPENAPPMNARLPIELCNLKKFSLQNWGSPLVGFFELLDMPSLQYLQYHSKIQTEYEPTDLLALLPRVSSTIETLVIHVTQYSLKDFIQCLRYCPNLKTLVNIPAYPEFSAMVIPRVSEEANITNIVTAIHWSDRDILNVISALEDDAVSYLVPKLQVFENFEPVGVTEDDLVYFISRRNGGYVPGVSKVKRFSMVIREAQVKPILEDLEPFVKGGLEVKICFEPSALGSPIPAYYDVGSAGYPSVCVPGSPAF